MSVIKQVIVQEVLIPAEAIIADQEVQSRAAQNDELINEYFELYKSGKVISAVIVFFDGEKYWLADGFHRFRAQILAGIRSIRVKIKNGSRRDAILFSAGCNATYGLRRNWKDVRHAVTKLLTDKEWGSWSNHKIADVCYVSHTYVSKIRNELTRNGFKFDVKRESTNGKVINTSRIGKVWDSDRIGDVWIENKPRPVSDQIEEQASTYQIVFRADANTEMREEIWNKIVKIRKQLESIKKVMKSKKRKLLALEAEWQLPPLQIPQ